MVIVDRRLLQIGRGLVSRTMQLLVARCHDIKGVANLPLLYLDLTIDES